MSKEHLAQPVAVSAAESSKNCTMTTNNSSTCSSWPETYFKPQCQVLKKEALTGPVTAVEIISIPSSNRHMTTDTNNDSNGQNEIILCMAARGPWIEVIPMNTPKQEVTATVATETKKGYYRQLVFGGKHDDESGSVHGIRYAYLPSTFNTKATASTNLWTFFGGRKLALFTTSNTTNWRDTINYNHDNTLFQPVWINSNGNRQSLPVPSSNLTLSDWIFDVRLIPLSNDQGGSTSDNNVTKGEDNKDESIRMLTAIGLAHNIVEIWSFHQLSSSQNGRTSIVVQPTRLQKFICETRCITYSLSLFGWDMERRQQQQGQNLKSPFDLSLAVAVGTVSNEILIWNVIDEVHGQALLNHENALFKNDPQQQQQQQLAPLDSIIKPISHKLQGHDGVIFSCKFNKDGTYLVSTSDDRTVRLWKRIPKGKEKRKVSIENTNDKIKRNLAFQSLYESPSHVKEVLDNESYDYTLVWTGYGHSARVWDSTFVTMTSKNIQSQNNEMFKEGGDAIVSSGEDGAIRVWSLDKGVEVATFRGHSCQSIWKISSNTRSGHGGESIVVTGGNDSTVKFWDLSFQTNNNNVFDGSDCTMSESSGIMQKFVVPEEKMPETESQNDSNNEIVESSQQQGNGVDNNETESKPKKKKKKKKPKNHSYVVFGIKLFGMRARDRQLLLATKQGTMTSLDLKTGIWSKYMPWAEPLNSEKCKHKIDPNNGSCIAMHPLESFLAVGTTRGQIILTEIRDKKVDSDSEISQTIFSDPKYVAIQGLHWIDNQNLLAFHIKGIIVWWNFSTTFLEDSDHSTVESEIKPKISRVLSMRKDGVTVGVPMSFSYDKPRSIIYIGDSRGNIAIFDVKDGDVSNEVVEQDAIDILTYVHKKEHVNCIIPTSDGKGILSVGNDGQMNECNLSMIEPKKLQRAMSRPASNLSGPSHIWRVKHNDDSPESIIIAGFYGNKFVMHDLTLGYQLLSVDTGGRQRQYDICIEFAKTFSIQNPTFHDLAIFVTKKNGPNEIHLHSYMPNLNQPDMFSPQLQYSIGSPCHGETILDIAFCKTKVPSSSLLISGSNDGTVKMSLFQQGHISFMKELPPHESCVRAICTSCHDNPQTSLVVVCGGKLSMNFYRLDQHMDKNSNDIVRDDLSVYLLCQNKLTTQPSIDHRMNAVKAIPLREKDRESTNAHLVLSGDSNGGLHLTVISEDLLQPKYVTSRTLVQDSRPILSVGMTRVSDDYVLACVGDTGGNVAIWVLPGTVIISEGQYNKDYTFDRPIPTEPVCTYTAHQNGTNSVDSILAKHLLHQNCQSTQLLITSGGDDQALCTCVLDVAINRLKDITVHISACFTQKEASSSAINGVKLCGNQLKGYRIYAIGYDQRMAIWDVDATCFSENASRGPITYTSSSPVDMSDVNCIDCCEIETNEGSFSEIVAAGGEGFEMFSMDSSIYRAAKALLKCNYLLITCGAGMSADSGLSTYESMPEDYSYYCNPLRLVEDPEQFQKFWFNFAEVYSKTLPHSGYGIIQNWCHGGLLKNLGAKHDQISPWWIYSSNVDGHFKGFDDTICEIHGRATEFRCANGIGYSDEQNRHGKVWNEWNRKVAECYIMDSCKFSKSHLNNTADEEEENNESLKCCRDCPLPVRPNVLMFHDTDTNVLRDIEVQRERYQKWEAQVEDNIVTEDAHLVILECGAGKNVPAVREESEEVFSDCLDRLRQESESNSGSGSVTCIRINPDDASFANFTNDSDKTICIHEKAEYTLKKINDWIQLLRKEV